MPHTLKRLFQTLGAGLLMAGAAFAQAPANDNFADAIALSAGLPASATGTNVGATIESGETHFEGAHPSVWWSWTATASTPVQVDTIGSNFDTVLEVFDGAALNALTTIAADDQSGGSNTSRLQFTPVAGHQYWIAVTGYYGLTGAISLQLSELPTITSPLTAEATMGLPFSYQITANNNPSSYYASGLPYGIYYDSTTGILSGTSYYNYTGTYAVSVVAYGSITASATLVLTLTSQLPVITSAGNASGAQGQLFTYQITATKNPTQYYCSSLPPGLMVDQSTGLISGTPTSPGTYYSTVYAANSVGAGDTVALNFFIESAAPAVTSDIISLNVGDPLSYQITATKNPMSFTADGSPSGVKFDGTTGVFSGKPRVSGFFPITLSATNSYGTTYGELDLSVYDPVSDSFAGRRPLVGNTIHRYISTDGATKEDGEPDHASAGGTGSVWWTWTAPASAPYEVTVDSGAPFAVYTGHSFATLHEVISNRDLGLGAPPTEVFVAVAGERYQIAIDSTVQFSSSTNFFLHKLGANATALLRVASTGGGTVSPGFLGTSFRRLGVNYTITAQAVPGYVFAGWTGSFGSAEPRLSFRMQAGISLVAQFTPSPFAGLKGGYMGLITSSTDTPASSTTGLFRINLSAGGAFSGTVTYANGTFPFHGVFSQDGTFTGTIARPHQWPLTVSLALDLANVPTTLSGTIGDDVASSAISASVTTYDPKTNPSASAGAYTFVMRTDVGSTGTGFGMVRVGASGAIRFVAVLPDGSRASQGGHLLDNAQWPLYASAYGGQGSLSGLVTFETMDLSDFDGSLNWLRPPSAGPGPNAGGFTASLTIAGSSYAVPPLETRVMALQNVRGNLTFEADFPGDGTTSEQTYQKIVTVSSANVVQTTGTDGFDLTFDVKTGLYRGHFRNPMTGAHQPFGGAVLQGQDAAYGLWAAPGGLVGPAELIPSELAGAPATGGSASSSGATLTLRAASSTP